VTFLIDGYNLMHAVGLASAKLPAGKLERARLRLLDWLADAADGRCAVLRVVFDAKSAPSASPESDHRGVRVAFAFRRTADELIEELVGAEPRPDRVTVVSNDGQVREAARRRGCGLHTCEAFVDWLVGGRPEARPLPAPEPDKPEPSATPDELAAWLAAFSRPNRK
jgi:predicted RNA-binding protein with PIN domain